ncbi:hypothetical protein JOE21_003391 [Desmospora profundinema]|uniref:Uncharacterized protein n=1 Tax=Desmospora profundinema TaxID=1571184 RepID=A0ABU1IRR4_9BACL|nr:hypothetical protein [Desmospora profundinema]
MTQRAAPGEFGAGAGVYLQQAEGKNIYYD